MSESKLAKALKEVAYKEADELLIEYDVCDYTFPDEFYKKMDKLINRRRKPYFRMINTVGKKVACIAIVFFIASATTVMSVDALRNAVFNFFINVFSTHSDIKTVDDDQHPDTIEDIYEITYDLSDFSVYDEFYDDVSRYTMYLKDNTECVSYNQYTKATFDIRINTEGAIIHHITLNGYDTIYYMNNNNYHTLIWDNGRYIFMVSSNISKENAFEIAESVKKVEDK